MAPKVAGDESALFSRAARAAHLLPIEAVVRAVSFCVSAFERRYSVGVNVGAEDEFGSGHFAFGGGPLKERGDLPLPFEGCSDRVWYGSLQFVQITVAKTVQKTDLL